MDPEANPVVHLVSSRTSAKNNVDKGANTDAIRNSPEDKPLEALETAVEEEEDVYPGDHNALAAWIVLAGSFLALFASFGLMVSIGTLQDYWQFHQLSRYTSRDIGWIPSVFVYLALVRRPPAQSLFEATWLPRGYSMVCSIFLLYG